MKGDTGWIESAFRGDINLLLQETLRCKPQLNSLWINDQYWPCDTGVSQSDIAAVKKLSIALKHLIKTKSLTSHLIIKLTSVI